MNESIKDLIRQSLAKIFDKVKDLKVNDDGSNAFKVVASTSDVDRVGDSLEVKKWDDENYKKNPVIMADHNYHVSHIVGKMTKLYKEDNKLMLEGIFTDITEYGKVCKDLYNAGFLKAVSVGFITYRDTEGKVLSYELLEVSFVAIPCHPDALSTEGKELMKKGIELGIVKEVREEKKEMIEVPKKEFDELKNDVAGIKNTLQLMADGKALPNVKGEDGNSDEQIDAIKTAFQGMGKNISHALFQMKKAKQD